MVKNKPYWLQRQFWRCNSRHGCLVTAGSGSHGFGYPESEEEQDAFNSYFYNIKTTPKETVEIRHFKDLVLIYSCFFKDHWERKKHYLLQFPLFIIAECKMHDLTAFSDFNINILQRKVKKYFLSILSLIAAKVINTSSDKLHCKVSLQVHWLTWRCFVKYKLRTKWHTMYSIMQCMNYI